MRGLFFYKRGFQFKLRSKEHFSSLAIGVKGDVDPLSGMIVNLKDLIKWCNDFQKSIRGQDFQTVLQFLKFAEQSYPGATCELFDHFALNIEYKLRLENNKYTLFLSAYTDADKNHWELEIQNEQQLQQALECLSKGELTTLQNSFQMISRSREELISERIFSES